MSTWTTITLTDAPRTMIQALKTYFLRKVKMLLLCPKHGALYGEKTIMKMTKQISIYLIPEHIQKLDQLVNRGLYASRNAAIRVAIIDLLRAEAEWKLEASDQLLYRIDLAARASSRGIRIKGEVPGL